MKPAVQAMSRGQLRQSLVFSQREGFASSLMTGAYDQYIIAFAVWLGASTLQIGWLNALPQFFGAVLQITAIWLGYRITRHRLIVSGALVQCLGLTALLVAAWPMANQTPLLSPLVWMLLAAVLYHMGANIVQPHWRAMMGLLVPDRLRGRYFGQRSRIAMFTSLVTFLCGGLVLAFTAEQGEAWLGFIGVFGIALTGRLLSVSYLARMQDQQKTPHPSSKDLKQILRLLRTLWQEHHFRRFTVFIASMQCCVAISGPFFAVYMLRDLQFSYLQFCLNTAASIVVQFLMLPFWGRQCDSKGNRYVMAICASVIPILPLLWLFSDDALYLTLVQMLSGLVWSGFSLATATYLYDLQPRNTHFAPYAALNASIIAVAVAVGSLLGGYLIQQVPTQIDLSGLTFGIERPITAIFLLSSLLRAAVVLWYLPTAPELRVKNRGRVRDLALRIARFTPISGVMLDIINSKKRD